MIRVLIVEDDKELNQAICRHLGMKQYLPTGCHNVDDAYKCLDKQQYDIILSDIMMPGINGFEFAEAIRQENENIPILFMTARDDYSSKQKGYKLGIDDYMVKPINIDELILHMEALLRRAKIVNQKKITVGNLVLDENEAEATIDGKPVTLTTREFQILYKLLSYPRQTFTRSQLLDEFNGLDNESSLRAIDVHITNIRAKMHDCDAFKIVTVRGLGYKAVLE